MRACHGQLGFVFRPIRAAGVQLGLLALAGCTCDPDAAAPVASAPLEWACRSDPAAARGSIRASGDPAASDEGPVLFAIELGRALRTKAGLVVPFLDHDGAQQRARAQLSLPEGGSRVVELGDVRGDAAPPQAATSEHGTYFAVREGAAAGENYRVARLTSGAEPTFSEAIAGGLDRSPSFDLAARTESVVLVWDDWDSSEGRGVVRSARFSLALDARTMARLSPESVDAESPRVISTASGYSVAWVALGRPSPATGGSEGDEPALRVTERWIQVLRLDPEGVPIGGPIDVSAPDGFVVGFDVIVGHGDFLMFALREDKSAPGVAGGTIRTVGVGPDGSSSERVVVDTDVGAGIPALAFDPDPKDGAPHGWLAHAAADGETRLVALAPDGAPIDLGAVRLELGEDTLLDAFGGRITVGRPRGRDVEIETMMCGPREKPAGPVLPPQEITE